MANTHLHLRGVLPPYLLDRLAGQGNERISACAAATQSLDRQLREQHGAAAARLHAARTRAQQANPGQAERAIYDASNTTQLPGTLARAEGQPDTGDPATDEAYAYLGATYTLFWEAYGRHSIDGRGLPLVGTVHYGQDYQNAFWDGQQMVFGDGDGEIFNRFTIAPDIVGHELTHGVIDSEAGLIYQDQAGALNESVSDVFGILVKQHLQRQDADESDWLIGAGLFTAQVQGQALRSMAQPGTAYDDPVLGKDPQPAHMNDFVITSEDNGGVHINSGIPNRAFYLTATAIGGPAWERAGRIWYDTLRDDRLDSAADFAAFARLTLDTATRLFGADSREQQAVQNAWNNVGLQP